MVMASRLRHEDMGSKEMKRHKHEELYSSHWVRDVAYKLNDILTTHKIFPSYKVVCPNWNKIK